MICKLFLKSLIEEAIAVEVEMGEDLEGTKQVSPTTFASSQKPTFECVNAFKTGLRRTAAIAWYARFRFNTGISQWSDYRQNRNI